MNQTKIKKGAATKAEGVQTDIDWDDFPTNLQKPRILILGYLNNTHMPALSDVAKANNVDCISFGEFLSGDLHTDPWLAARECVDKGDALFVHLCRGYCQLFGVAAAGLVMYALARGGKVVMMFDTDVTIHDLANFASLSNALGWRELKFILPDATPAVLKHFLAHTRLIKE